MNSKLGLTRTVVRRNYALLAPDGHVTSVFPGWRNCTPVVMVSGATGAGLSQYLFKLNAAGSGDGKLEGEQWFLYVVSGRVKVNGEVLSEGGFAYLPPRTHFKIRGAAKDSQLLVFAKGHEPHEGEKPLKLFHGHERSIVDVPFLGDPRARLKTLIPDSMSTDMAVNIFTFDPGATLPFVETHVMEHGMFFLEGSGVYRLDEDWHPVTKGDALWIAPYCPQWFIAAGPGAARYIYYKDVNRMPR